MEVAVAKVTMSKNPVSTSEKFKISVDVKEVHAEPVMYRLPHGLGKGKGGIK